MKIEKLSLRQKIQNYFVKDSSSRIDAINDTIDFVTKNKYYLDSIENIRFDLNPQNNFSYHFDEKSINIPIKLDLAKDNLYKGIELF
jgi:hypothetical protein